MNKAENKIEKQKFKMSEVIILVLGTFAVSIVIGLALGKKFNYSSDVKTISEDANIKTFVENYNYILNNYYKDIDGKTLIEGAINGMTSSLEDPYASYYDETSSKNFNIVLNGQYTGIGIEYIQNTETNEIIIGGIFKNSSAEQQGLKVGDIIIWVDEINLQNSSSTDLSNYILNSEKNKFVIKVKRDNEELNFTVTKGPINIESVQSKIYERKNKKIGYIYLSIFAQNTYTQFKTALDNLEKENIDSLIIDVRGNSGGHLITVENILKTLLTKKQVAYMVQDKKGVSKTYGSSKSNKEYPILLLGDNSSASASEVLISSLVDNLNSVFIGEITYGKGTVQELVSLSDSTQYKITTQRWLTPKQVCVTDTKGIKPTIELKLNDKYYDTYLEDDDNQLQAAIEYLLNN